MRGGVGTMDSGTMPEAAGSGASTPRPTPSPVEEAPVGRMIQLRDILKTLTHDGGEKQAFADLLRDNQTSSERMMARVFYHLGIHAEPQVVLHGYIVDFLDTQTQTVIEVDGSVHQGQSAYDARRDRQLEDHGYRVIRLYNEQVVQLMQDIAAEKSGAL